MINLLLPDLTFWWTWIPLYLLAVGLLVGIILTFVWEDFMGLAVGAFIGVFLGFIGGLSVMSSFNSIEQDALETAIIEETGYSNLEFIEKDRFVAENKNGDFVTGFVDRVEGRQWVMLTSEK